MQEEVSEFAAFVGIDWADRKHDVCLQVAGAEAVELSVVERELLDVTDASVDAAFPRKLDHVRRQVDRDDLRPGLPRHPRGELAPAASHL